MARARFVWVLPLAGCGPALDSGSDGLPRPETGVEEVPGHTGEPTFSGLARVAVTCGVEVPDEPKVPCTLRVETEDGDVVYDGLAGLERRGRSSLHFPKPQFAVELWEAVDSLVPRGAEWRYLDGGVAPPEGWVAAGFDDTAWSVGAAPLGYGDPDGDPVTTAVAWGDDPADKPITTWFRTTFEVVDPAAYQALSLAVRRDDGARVFLNGAEAWRDNLPDGEIGAETPALVAVSGEDEGAFTGTSLDPGLLVAGTNVLAVEVHQATPGSSDLVFDLALDGVGPDRSVDLFGMGAEDDWILNGNYVDRALFRNWLSFDLFRAMGRFAPQLVPCEVTLDGDWLGIYTLGERVDADDDRLDLQEDPAGGSFIVKSDDRDPPLVENTVGYGDWVLVWPDDASEAAREAMAGFIRGWQDAVFRWDGTGDDGIFAYVDMDTAVDLVLLQEFARNADAYTLSVHLARDAGGTMRFVPWDLDLSYGYPVTDCGAEGWLLRQDFIWAMSDDPTFRARMLARWAELRAGVLAEEAVLDRIEDYREVMGDTVYENFERWPMEEITFEWGGQDWLCPVASHDEEVARFQGWVRDRLAWMDANLATY